MSNNLVSAVFSEAAESVNDLLASGGPKRQKSSTELRETKRAIEVAFHEVPIVAAGGLVGPMVPVARTPTAFESAD